MATEYNCFEHTHVVVSPPDVPKEDRYYWRGTHSILLHVGDRVFIPGHYEYLCPEHYPDVRLVTDNAGASSYDRHGCCIISVPAAWCQYFDEIEAEAIDRCIDADDQLLSYAY